jgi:hypothetical protein
MSEFDNTTFQEEMVRKANISEATNAVTEEQKRIQCEADMQIAKESMLRGMNQKSAASQAEIARKEQISERESQLAKDKANEEMIRKANQRRASMDAENARKEKMESTDIPMETVDAKSAAQEELIRSKAMKDVNAASEEERGRRISVASMKSVQEDMLKKANKKVADAAFAEGISEAASRGEDDDDTKARKIAFATVTNDLKKREE